MEVHPLRLIRFQIANFKSIQRLELDGMGSLALFMGRNNAGKSNILDSFKFLADAAVGLDHALASRGRRFSEIVFRKQEGGKLEFEFAWALPSDKRAELARALFQGHAGAALEKVLASGFLSTVTLKVSLSADEFSEELSVANSQPDGWPPLVFSIHGTRQETRVFCGGLETLCAKHAGELPPMEPLELAVESVNPFRLRLSRPRGAERYPVSRELAEMVWRQFTTLEWVDPLRRLPSSAEIQGEEVISPDASNLPDVLHWLYNNKPKTFRRIEGEVAKLVPQLGRLYTPTQQNTATLGLMDSQDEELVFSMDQMSFGTRSLIAIVAKVVLTKPGAWVCVEEPETYLHPQAQVGLFHFLREQSALKRVFVATHSTQIAASCPIDSLFVVARDEKNRTTAARVTEATALPVIELLGVKPSFSFEAEAIAFVESAHAAAALDAWMKRRGLKVPAQFIDMEGGATLHFFANARVASSRFVQSLVFAVFGGEPAGEETRRARARARERLHLSDGQVIALERPCVEAYLLDAKAIHKAFPSADIPEAELEEALARARGQADAAQALGALFAERQLGEFNGAAAARIAQAMETVPPEFVRLFDRIDLESKPFWKI